MTPEIEKLIRDSVRDTIKAFFDANYSSGDPHIPPHTHDGVDNLQIDASTILNLPAQTPSNPAGNDKDIQFNNAGVFAGDDNFTWDTNNAILDIEGVIQSSNSPFTVETLGASALTIQTGTGTGGDTGDIIIQTQDPDLSGNNASGNITIKTGVTKVNNKADITITAGTGIGSKDGGDITITSGGSQSGTAGDITINTSSGTPNSGITISDNNSGGAVNINTNGSSGGTISLSASDTSSGVIVASAGAASLVNAGTLLKLNLASGQSLITLDKDGGGNGRITLDANILTSIAPYRGGTTTGNVLIFFGLSGSALGSSSAGTIFIGNVQSVPSTDPVAGGQLYVQGGALKYRGSGGTITTIAPA